MNTSPTDPAAENSAHNPRPSTPPAQREKSPLSTIIDEHFDKQGRALTPEPAHLYNTTPLLGKRRGQEDAPDREHTKKVASSPLRPELLYHDQPSHHRPRQSAARSASVETSALGTSAGVKEDFNQLLNLKPTTAVPSASTEPLQQSTGVGHAQRTHTPLPAAAPDALNSEPTTGRRDASEPGVISQTSEVNAFTPDPYPTNHSEDDEVILTRRRERRSSILAAGSVKDGSKNATEEGTKRDLKRPHKSFTSATPKLQRLTIRQSSLALAGASIDGALIDQELARRRREPIELKPEVAAEVEAKYADMTEPTVLSLAENDSTLSLITSLPSLLGSRMTRSTPFYRANNRP
ncbi:hypothetical protein KEM56_003749 [Ascosphaera pollenicola]|nr:hypothetical protein KEM56_003749 [Ascosphaera pollenicola]